MLKAQNLEDKINDDHAQIFLALEKLYEMFDLIDFVDENSDGIPDSLQNSSQGNEDDDGGFTIID
jgi:hypothetical protein